MHGCTNLAVERFLRSNEDCERRRGRGQGVEGKHFVGDVGVGTRIGAEGKGIAAGDEGKGTKFGESELPCAETETLVRERVQVGAAF